MDTSSTLLPARRHRPVRSAPAPAARRGSRAGLCIPAGFPGPAAPVAWGVHPQTTAPPAPRLRFGDRRLCQHKKVKVAPPEPEIPQDHTPVQPDAMYLPIQDFCDLLRHAFYGSSHPPISFPGNCGRPGVSAVCRSVPDASSPRPFFRVFYCIIRSATIQVPPLYYYVTYIM